MTGNRRIVVLAGGVGGAKLAHGLALASASEADQGRQGLELSIVVNTGDDLELHGLAISPDLDTVLYTLAGLANSQTGWGVIGDTWSGSEMLGRLGGPTWFRLGDKDLALQIERTRRLRAGETLTQVTAAFAQALDVSSRVLPMTDDSVRTELRTDDGWLEFQDYFVRRGHRDAVHELRFRDAQTARPTEQVLSAIFGAELIAIAPSNPFVSVGTILAVPGIRDALLASPAPTVAVSPIVAGAAIKGPADDMLRSLGGVEVSATGVARHYTQTHPGLLDWFVLDEQDRDQEAAIAALGVRTLVLPTVMRSDADRASLATAILSAIPTG